MLNKDIFKILENIKRNNPSSEISLSSNSFLLNDKLIKRLYIYKVNIIFQSLDENNFAKITWVFGLPKIKENIILFKKHGIKVWINYVYTSKNKNELDRLVTYSKEQNIDLKILELVKNDLNNNTYENIDDAVYKFKKNNIFFPLW